MNGSDTATNSGGVAGSTSNTDLSGIATLLRMHIEIRNRSWMKRVHRDCFLGTDAVTFLLTQGLADTRAQAVTIGQAMMDKKLVKHVSDPRRKFSDAYMYYRFAEDDAESSVLAATNAGNGQEVHLGQGGCKFSFAPHTAHNSFVLDIALAEEVERAVAGASIETRSRAFAKLRARVKEEAENDSNDWVLSQSTEVNKVSVNVYERIRPRGDFKNVKMTGMVGLSPKAFIAGMMSLDPEKRSVWDSMYQDGVLVESVDIGEESVLSDKAQVPGSTISPDSSASSKVAENKTTTLGMNGTQNAANDVNSFLQTVDLAGIPAGMSIAFLNDPERQQALAHLRRQMMLSKPRECMRCDSVFASPADIRFCPCCAMVSCASCVSRRVFEIASRQVVNLCVHCWRESSRIRHPPDAVRDKTGLDQTMVGKWWRLEDLGLPGYNQGKYGTGTATSSSVGTSGSSSGTSLAGTNEMQNSDDMTPLLAGLMDDLQHQPVGEESSSMNSAVADALALDGRDVEDRLEGLQEGDEDDENEGDEDEGRKAMVPFSGVANNENESVPPPESESSVKKGRNSVRMARCKQCGELIARDMEAIEQHSLDCAMSEDREPSRDRNNSIIGSFFRSASLAFRSDTSSSLRTASVAGTDGDRKKTLGGVSRKPESDLRGDTRVIYRVGHSINKKYRPRDACALQDAFCDPDGTYYCYEISVRHCDVRGTRGHVTSDVMVLMHVARPVKGNKNLSNLTIVSQVDTRAKGAQWWWPFMPVFKAGGDLVAAKKMDLVRELKACGNLQNILPPVSAAGSAIDGSSAEEEETKANVSLEDFELLAVLGRGGFGKVMQVRHKTTGGVYAMKILKKTELRRRKQVERTQTERTILAAVRHPFIVCLHFAFQNNSKLYMVMDFVQGGDFFTLMRKFRKLPEEWVRLYVAEIAMALQHLHDMDVVYRDLKPENILLSGDGHLKLTDFGLSRFFEMRPPAPEDIIGEDVVTKSFCGTEQYMSPEMLLQQGHNYKMDWWCLGLLMHEMITARHPFHGATHYDTLRNMVSSQPKIDPRLSVEATNVVKGLLVKNPMNRLCGKTGINELKNMPFFSDLDWDELYNRQIVMPYQPELNSALDLSSFEKQFTGEAPVDSIAADGDEKGKTKSGSFLNFLIRVKKSPP